MNSKLSRKKFIHLGLAAGLSPSFFPSELLAQTENPYRGIFDDDSTAEEVTAGLNLKGKTILVTGANSGLGYETMRVLALRGATVLALARTRQNADEAVKKVTGTVIPFACDLSSYDSVHLAAEAIKNNNNSIDGLICNAGIMMLPELQLAGGLEMQFVVNYLGHFLLTQLLLPGLNKAPQGRIVLVSSGYYKKAPAGGIDFNNLAGQISYDGLAAYGRSKLAMALYAREFSRRFPTGSVTANALHPGVIATNLGRHMPWYMQWGAAALGWAFMKSVEEGAATQCYVATHPSLAVVSGHFFSDCNPVLSADKLLDNPELGKKLWEFSVGQIKKYL